MIVSAMFLYVDSIVMLFFRWLFYVVSMLFWSRQKMNWKRKSRLNEKLVSMRIRLMMVHSAKLQG